MSLQGLEQKTDEFPLKYIKKLKKVKSLSFLLACLLWLLRWKTQVLSTHLALLGLDSGWGRTFRFRWYQCLSRDLLGSLTGRSGINIRVRPKDLAKFRVLQGQPSLFLTGHFHNWEALAAWMASHQVPLLGAARPLASPCFNSLLSRLRTRTGVPVVTHNILSTALSHLQAGHCFGVLWDQYSPFRRHSSPLFGIPAAMDPLPEILVRRRRPAVMAGFLLPDGTLRLVPLLPAGSDRFHPVKLSRRYHRVLETVIRAHPTHWYGLCHARFKDTVEYPGRGKVSRETMSGNSASRSYVSRETQAAGTALRSQG